MTFGIFNNVLLSGSLMLLLGVSTSLGARKMQRLDNGTWGGQHIRIEINNATADVEYDCASGEISGPFTVDRQGNFSWRGLFFRSRPGPTRIDEKQSRQAAIYSGSIKGDIMTLTVKLEPNGALIDSFTLKRGSPGRVFKCK